MSSICKGLHFYTFIPACLHLLKCMTRDIVRVIEQPFPDAIPATDGFQVPRKSDLSVLHLQQVSPDRCTFCNTCYVFLSIK